MILSRSRATLMGNQKGRKCKGTTAQAPKLQSIKIEHDNETVVETGAAQSVHEFSQTDVVQLRQKLLSWYDKHKRDLPWRKVDSTDINVKAYAVWVSEIMLQQTQVATVIKYYNSWMKKWPTLHALAAADIESVNEAWKGLGYYSRGKRLFEGAKKVVEELRGQMPCTAEGLQKQLPGVGRYTAGAVASIAFNQRTGLVDGNVIRVFARLRAIGGNSTQNDVIEHFWSLANVLVPPSRPGDLNQSLMELGATVCTPKAPRCDTCPVSDHCFALKKVKQNKSKSAKKVCSTIKEEENKEEIVDIECLVPDCRLCLPIDDPWNRELGVMNYPRKPKKAKAREETVNVVILSKNLKNGEEQEAYLLSKRPSKGLLAGLWEFPNEVQKEDDIRNKKDISTFISSVLDVSKDNIRNTELLGQVGHQFSHIHHTYNVWSCCLADEAAAADGPLPTPATLQWVTQGQMKGTAIPTGMVKVFNLLQGQARDKHSRKRKMNPENDVQIVEGHVRQKSISDFFKRKSN